MNKMDIFFVVTSSIFVYGCLILLLIAEFGDGNEPAAMLFAAAMAATVLNIVFLLRCRCQTGKTTNVTFRVNHQRDESNSMTAVDREEGTA